LTLAHDKGMAVLNAAPYGSGMLAKGPDAYPRYAYQDAPAEMVDRVRRIGAICERHGVPVPAVALQFSTRDRRICNTIVGMSKPERLAQTVEYLTMPIPDAVWDELAELPFDADDPELNRFRR
jgi:D-threo-aldose 1-dehydrogenase